MKELRINFTQKFGFYIEKEFDALWGCKRVELLESYRT